MGNPRTCQEPDCTNDALYRCPRCSWLSCSLVCCRAHKLRVGCSGKRDRTAFCSLGQMDDGTMTNDYFFLEDVLKQMESSRRLSKEVGVHGHNNSRRDAYPTKRLRMSLATDHVGNEELRGETDKMHPIVKLAEQSASVSESDHLPVDRALETDLKTANGSVRENRRPQTKWGLLVKEAAVRNIHCVLMPPVLSRHKNNKSYYNKRTGTIQWTVECVWYPPSSRDDSPDRTQPTSRLISMDENKNVWSVVEEFLPGLAEHADVSLFLKRLPCPSNKPLYMSIPTGSSLVNALKGFTVFEYPTIHVVPRSRQEEFPQSIQLMQTTPTSTSRPEEMNT